VTPTTDAWSGAERIVDESACLVCGRESCEGHGDVPEEQPAGSWTSRLPSPPNGEGHPAKPEERRWQRACDALDLPTPEEVIEGIAWQDSITVLVGESTAGKTFVELSLAASLSAGLSWHGRNVEQGSAIYVFYEGHPGLRLKALRCVGGQLLEHVFIVRGDSPLSPIIDRDRVETPSLGEIQAAKDINGINEHIKAEGLPPVRLLEIDTVRASMSGSEDSSEAASGYLRAVRRLMALVPGAACILAHHAGWQDGEARRKRERGSSAFRGNVDATLYLEASDYDRDKGTARLTLSTLKVRDGETMPPLHLIRRRVELPGLSNRWGQPVMSCIVERDFQSREDREREQKEAAQAAVRTVDLRTLRIIAERPAVATSQEGIRIALGVKAAVARESISSLVERGLVLPPAGQRKPYTVTADGQRELVANPSGSQSVPVGPGSDSD
jgi:hypothetical protein